MIINGRDRVRGQKPRWQIFALISALEEYFKLPPQVSDILILLLPRLTGQRRTQPLHLSHPHLDFCS